MLVFTEIKESLLYFDGQKSENIPTILRYHVHIIVIHVLQIFSVSLLWLMVSMHIVDQWFEIENVRNSTTSIRSLHINLDH